MSQFFLSLSAVLLLTSQYVFAQQDITPVVDGRTWIVSNSGDDSNPGSESRPLRTISRAASVAQPGDTILVRAGVYRERVTPPRGGQPDRPITYRGEKLGSVFLKGSDEWKPAWMADEGSVFYANLSDEMFTDDVYLDDANPFRVPLASTPYGKNGRPELERFGKGDESISYNCGQLFVDGVPWKQCARLEDVRNTVRSWFYDVETKRIYVNFVELEPAKCQVEITTRRRIFAPHVRGLGHIIVEGFVMEHCGNQYPTNFWSTPKWAQAGALGLRGGHHWIVRNNLIRYANFAAMDVGSGGGENERDPRTINKDLLASDNLIENNYLVDNGGAGIIGSTSRRMVIRGNVILRNNYLRFDGKKRYEHAGIKCHYIRDGLIERNYVADSPLSDGIWLDNQFPGARITRNVVVNNGGRGIFLEMSDYKFDTAFVDHNVSIGNRKSQFYVHDASGSTVLHNLFANSPPNSKYGQGVYIYQVTARTIKGYHTVFNNILVNHRGMLDINYPSHRSGPQRINHNVYDVAKDEQQVFFINSYSDRPSPWSAKEFAELIQEEVGSEKATAASGARVAMDLDGWRKFWKHHGQENDTQSLTCEGMQVSYDPR
ncbi:MAG: right-handed parallel beta-helix repeat-containing protein, partial [Planctomycetota bacterium]